MEDIKNYAIKKFQAAYGYCGVADAGSYVLLNSGAETETLKIIFEEED